MLKNSGQSLIEITIAVAIIGVIITSAAGGLFMIIRSNEIVGKTQSASVLASALAENLISLSEGNWHAIYGVNKGSANKYYLATSTGQFAVTNGTEMITADSFLFVRYFYIENVERDGDGDIGVGDDDPSTQKATVVVSYDISGSSRTIAESLYLTRWRNNVFRQMDWSGGDGQDGPLTMANSGFFSSANMDYSTTPGTLFVPSGANCNNDACELISSTFDTGSVNGAGFNTIAWQGTYPAGSTVKFKFASSNDSGGPWSWSGAPVTPAGPNAQARIDQVQHNDDQYFRYKVIMEKNGSNQSPQVEDIIVGYSH